MNVLLDTNIWISGLLWGGNPRKIIQLAITKQIVLYSSKLLIDELRLTLAYPKLQRRLATLEITAEELLIEVSQITQLSYPVHLFTIPELRDPKDKIVLETALSVPVEIIVSGYKDLLILREFQKIPILTTKQFLENYQFLYMEQKINQKLPIVYRKRIR
ncbi:putative toxin-antitoxin system toxin component, PIN family [Pleurocapsa sp. CCALA 161]|uniref:putative toxin-antitoxin system toxin component, PIN family n=1 Tax=Pleurocapsa sp. CCALA 161 TaxID=2107688 RepID=UPI000D055DAA|nr:putative toxin-antitoxin system toxin component, PIN family [Pleurocapsa sp. CCALA 161]PSB06757.1 putative toxin-antitoxin system toxin component, PIN family [Pleurocapsa sp. CCALA 161]